MAQSGVERELKLIRKRLDSIEEALGEEMSREDKKALKEALEEHKTGKTIPFDRVRKR
jgi:hypothetical protein